MTTSQLYAIYLGAYADAKDLLACGLPAADIELGWHAGLSPIERAIASFALLDATNGTPLRSRAQFEHLVHGGASMLRGLERRARERHAQSP